MTFTNDWNVLKAAIEEKKELEEGREEPYFEEEPINICDSCEVENPPDCLTFNKTDLAVLNSLIQNSSRSLKDLRADSGKSRVSVYLSIKKLRESSLIEDEQSIISLSENPVSVALRKLSAEGFDITLLTGERLLLLQSLKSEKTIDQLAVECEMSVPSVYKYINELRPILSDSEKKYLIDKKQESLMGFLDVVADELSEDSVSVCMWSWPEGKIIKSEKPLEGSLTAFSRFSEFGVDYSPNCLYYHVPKKNLSIEDVFVHAMRCVEGPEMDSAVYSFYLKNREHMDIFLLDELSLYFEVFDVWLGLQAKFLDSSQDMSFGNLKHAVSAEPEEVMFSKSLSSDPGSILICERVLMKEKLDWEKLFSKYMELAGDTGLRWQALINRFDIIEKRTNSKIPIKKKLFKTYLEADLLGFLREPRSVVEMKKKFLIPEYHLRNTLTSMSSRGAIKKLDTKPIKFMVN